MRKILFLLAAILILFVGLSFAEEIRLSTIVPDQTVLRSKKGAIGNTYCMPASVPTSLLTDPPASDVDLLVEGNVGIGTMSPHLPAPGPGGTPATGNLDVNDVYLRSASKWASEGGGPWATNGNDIYNINTGNVGIGITTPISYKLQVNGSFAAQYKNFEIPHPQYPDTKLLVHSSLEGPEHAVFYRGEGRLINGKAQIKLPDYFESLTIKENRTVQITPFDGYSPLYVEGQVKDSKFTVRTVKGGSPNQKFYWEVKAVRADIPLLQAVKEKNGTK